MTYSKTNNELLIYLWNHCNNRCTFCYNQTLYHLPLNIKEHLQICNDMLNSNFMENFNYLRLLGGELFDGSIDQLGIRNEFFKILETCIKLIKEGKLDKLNFLTNLIYADNKDLRDTLKLFDDNGLIDHIDMSSSYDIVGRFSEVSEKWWWNNIKWLGEVYPQLHVDVGIIMTQPFITTVTKEWIDEFYKKSEYRCEIKLNELDTALIKNSKIDSPFSNLFPKRHDFLKFLYNLKAWNYYKLVGVEPGGISPWNRTFSIQYIQSGDLSFPIFKNPSYLLAERAEYKQDGYIDSDVPLFDDIKKVLEL